MLATKLSLIDITVIDMKKEYTNPKIDFIPVSMEDILSGSEVLIDGSVLFPES